MTEGEAAALARWYALPAATRRAFATAALDKNPSDTEAAFALYEACDQLADRPAARAALEACLRADPTHAAARHLLSAMGAVDGPGAAAASPPAGYVAALFDGYAPNFDRHLTGELRYSIPEALASALTDATSLPLGAPGYGRAIDLGCGTGLSGVPFRSVCRTLIGVDLSSGMLAQAASKELYDELLHTDVVDGLRAQPRESMDLILCADTLMYVGDLVPFFDACTSAANAGCRLAVSVESLECAVKQREAEGETDLSTLGVHVGPVAGDIVLLESGRYAHGDRYVLRLAEERGWEALLLRDVVGRYDGPREVWATLYVFVKRSP